MPLDLDASFAVHSTCSLLSLRFFDVKASVFPYFANGSCQIQTYLLLEAFIKVTNDLVIFHNVFFYEFSALLRAQILPIEQSTATTIDQILAKGNYCILILLKVDPSMTQTPCPCMDHLPNVTCWSIEHMVHLVG